MVVVPSLQGVHRCHHWRVLDILFPPRKSHGQLLEAIDEVPYGSFLHPWHFLEDKLSLLRDFDVSCSTVRERS
jgi:hypothetical protein